MKNFLLILLAFLSASSFVFAQSNPKEQAIVDEGIRLYTSEMASWHGTGVFLENFSHKRSEIGGYFSYQDGEKITCVFFDKQSSPELLASLSFDETFDTKNVEIDTLRKAFNKLEKDLYTIRKEALETVYADKSDFFSMYERTNYNLIPLIYQGEKKVYILTAPQESGVVILGNDYLMTFDTNNKLKSKEKLHQNLITIQYDHDQEDIVSIAAMHTHSKKTGHFIAPTDICTLMLYAPYAQWKQHFVVGKKFVSIWDCENHSLVMMKTKAWKKLYKNLADK